MKIFRIWKDNGDKEEITMKELCQKLEGNFKDVDLAIEGMKAGNTARTCFAIYLIEQNKLCQCGRGYIEYDEEHHVSLYQVFTDGFSFGRPEYADCCKQCEQDQRNEYEKEQG